VSSHIEGFRVSQSDKKLDRYYAGRGACGRCLSDAYCAAKDGVLAAEVQKVRRRSNDAPCRVRLPFRR